MDFSFCLTHRLEIGYVMVEVPGLAPGGGGWLVAGAGLRLATPPNFKIVDYVARTPMRAAGSAFKMRSRISRSTRVALPCFR